MTQIKTPAEIVSMQKSGRILAEILDHLRGQVSAGMKTIDIDSMARAELKRHGALPAFLGYEGFPASICISVNEEIVHGIPSERVLQEGDLVKLDFGVTYEGMITDSAITLAIGKTKTINSRLVSATEEALNNAIAVVRDGVRVGDISSVIGSTIQKRGFHVLQSLGGHGVGHRVHEDLWIANDGVAGTGQVLRAGMTIALEPIASIGTEDYIMADDGWTCVTDDGSWAAQSEHTILITPTGSEIITLL